MVKSKVGLINVGHSPRIDFISIHRNWFNAQGADIEIIEVGSMDGLTYDEIHKTESPLFDPDKPLYSPDTGMGSLVNREGGYDWRLGNGWSHVWTPKKDNLPRIQRAIERLEEAGVEIIILLCCLEYPINYFKSKVPFIMPWKITFDYVKTLADTMDKPNIGILAGHMFEKKGKARGQGYERNLEIWNRPRWTRDVTFYYGQRPDNEYGLDDIDFPSKVDLIIVFGYHSVDLRDGVPGKDCLSLQLYEKYNCPVISSMGATLSYARALLKPPIDELSFYKPMHK